MKPDPVEWANNLKQRYDLTDIRFFGDFSQQAMSKELVKIRQISNQIIETKNASENFKKDFTDFIMLDSIYKAAMFLKSINVFIFFTGDGHFSSVAATLKNSLHKTVVVYGVKNSFSNALKAASTEWYEIPSETDVFKSCYTMIFKYIAYVESQRTSFRPTFWNTVKSVSRYNGVDQSIVSASLRQLIERKYIHENLEQVKFRTKIRVLIVDWEKAIQDGLWDPDLD